MKKHIFILIGLFLLLIFASVFFMEANGLYKRANYNLESNCLNYFQECKCLGSLLVLESYPAQFECKGIEFCKNIEEVICRN